MKTLKELVGQYVEVKAGDDCADSNGIYFSLYGKLEAPEDDYERYYLRIGDTPSGCMGIGFHPKQVLEIHSRVYHYCITMRETLNAPFE